MLDTGYWIRHRIYETMYSALAFSSFGFGLDFISGILQSVCLKKQRCQLKGKENVKN